MKWIPPWLNEEEGSLGVLFVFMFVFLKKKIPARKPPVTWNWTLFPPGGCKFSLCHAIKLWRVGQLSWFSWHLTWKQLQCQLKANCFIFLYWSGEFVFRKDASCVRAKDGESLLGAEERRRRNPAMLTEKEGLSFSYLSGLYSGQQLNHRLVFASRYWSSDNHICVIM